MSTYYIAGIIVGVCVGLAILAVTKYQHRKKYGSAQYDERQMVGRGKAFQAGFFTSLITNLLYSTYNYLDPLPGEPFLWQMGCMALSILVFVLVAIHYDAYLSLTDKPETFLRTSVLLTVAMALIGFGNLRSKYSNHTAGIIQMMIAGMWLIITVAMLIRIYRDIKESDAEKEQDAQ